MRFPEGIVVGGVNIDHTVRGPQLPTPDRPVVGEVFLRTVGGKGLNQAVAAAPGVNARLTLVQIDATRTPVARARVLLAQLEVPVRAVERAFRLARAASVYTVLDPSPRQQIPIGLLRLVDAISANADEAAEITGIRVNSKRSAKRAAAILATRGPALVVIGTPEGRLVFHDGGAEWLENVDVPVVDTTGAGDACAVAIAVAVARGRYGREAARDGHYAAAIAVTRLGGYPSLPRGRDLRSLRAGLEGA